MRYKSLVENAIAVLDASYDLLCRHLKEPDCKVKQSEVKDIKHEAIELA